LKFLQQISPSEVYNNTIYSTDPTDNRTVFMGKNENPVDLMDNIIFGNLNMNLENNPPNDVNNIWKNKLEDAYTSWFEDKTTGNLALTSNATEAINQGTNLVTDRWNGDLRAAFDSKSDIGADEYESPQDVELSPLKPSYRLNPFPNPFKGSGTLTMKNTVPHQIKKISILDISGKIVITLFPSSLKNGTSHFYWNGTNQLRKKMHAGTYFLRYSLNNSQGIEKIILIK